MMVHSCTIKEDHMAREDRKVFSVGLPEDLVHALDQYAVEYMRQNKGSRMSRSGAIEKLCRDMLAAVKRKVG